MQKIIEAIVTKIKEADAVVIGAGAGMSAAAGIDYTDSDRFKRLFPNMYKKGFRNNYELMGDRGLPDSVNWGYLAMNIQHVAYDNQVAEVYQQLLSLVKDKDYFVMTSNVDTMFEKNFFDPARIYTPQGNYKLLQCLKPCSDETYDTRPFLDTMLAALDPTTDEVADKKAIPACPKCGGPMFMNVRGGDWFIEKPNEVQRIAFQTWLSGHLGKKMAVLDLGTGFNTPGVIRWPMERITYQNPNATLIRINRDHPQVPKEIASRSISLAVGIDDALNKITAVASNEHDVQSVATDQTETKVAESAP
eukprot:GILI01020817.1.p1 GENE.GILI01020817.1~~GILI01020817.1.p1  ORF type:complete len:305 (-),score=40.27 GILI01020817.1:204-1118(-)